MCKRKTLLIHQKPSVNQPTHMEHQDETRTAGITNLPAVYYNWSARTATLVPFAFFKEIVPAGPSSSGTLKIGPTPWGSPQIIAQLISLEQSGVHVRPTYLQPIKEKTIYHSLGRSAHSPKSHLLLGNAACWYWPQACPALTHIYSFIRIHECRRSSYQTKILIDFFRLSIVNVSREE